MRKLFGATTDQISSASKKERALIFVCLKIYLDAEFQNQRLLPLINNHQINQQQKQQELLRYYIIDTCYSIVGAKDKVLADSSFDNSANFLALLLYLCRHKMLQSFPSVQAMFVDLFSPLARTFARHYRVEFATAFYTIVLALNDFFIVGGGGEELAVNRPLQS